MGSCFAWVWGVALLAKQAMQPPTHTHSRTLVRALWGLHCKQCTGRVCSANKPAAFKTCNLSSLFCVSLPLYYKANGRKTPSFYKDGVNNRAVTNRISHKCGRMTFRKPFIRVHIELRSTAIINAQRLSNGPILHNAFMIQSLPAN